MVFLAPKKERPIIEDEFLKQPETHNWTAGSERLSEFNVLFLSSMAFPTLLPDGKGDPTLYLISQIIQRNHLLRGSNI